MKKKSPAAPFGYLFITIALSTQMWEQGWGNIRVILDQVALGDSQFWPKRLFEDLLISTRSTTEIEFEFPVHLWE